MPPYAGSSRPRAMACSTAKSPRPGPRADLDTPFWCSCRWSGAGRGGSKGGAPVATTTGKQETAASVLGGLSRQGGSIKRCWGILAIFVVLSMIRFRLQCLFPREITTLVSPPPPRASKYPARTQSPHRAGLIPLRSWGDGAQGSSFL